jgi:energy-coupling factor transport system ATP-binding protein
VNPFIVTQGLKHVYQLDGSQIEALRGIDLTVQRGEFVALVGANGSGKSTLVKHLNVLLLPSSGAVWIDRLSTSDSRNLWPIRQKVGIVFQNPDNQLVATTVEEDVAFGPENLGIPSQEIRRRVNEALATVDLLEYRLHPPHRLSGGQKQLVVIAGALAMRPECLVLDEPTSMLDPLGRRQVLAALQRLWNDGLTVVLITHSMAEAATAQRVIVMDDGRIALDGSPRDVFAQVERLRDLRLDVPPIAQIAHELRQRGMPLPGAILSVDEMVRALEDFRTRISLVNTERIRVNPCPANLVAAAGHAGLIHIEGLTHIYAPGTLFERTALRDVNLEIRAGENIGIMGPTGSGKSTLVQHLAGLLVPMAGRVLIDNVDTREGPRARAAIRKVGLAFQYPEDQMFEQNVFQEVAFGPRNLGLTALEIEERVSWALEMVGLAPAMMHSRVPFTLSGGEMRRVALASVLAMRPAILILDEPTAGQDPQSRKELLARIRALHAQGDLTLIVVSHAMEEIAGLVDRIVILRNGHLVADATAREVLSNAQLLHSVGLDVPEPRALMLALRQQDIPVCADVFGVLEAVAEISRVYAPEDMW